MNEKKMRVWWIPQIGTKTFYIPVRTPEEAKMIMDILSAYDCFQYNQRVKPDYCNAGGLQMWSEEENDWIDWYYETGNNYYDDVEEYCEEKSSQSAELSELNKALFKQVHFD